MPQKILANIAISAFCENMGMLIGTGIGADEAAALLCDDTENNSLHDAAKYLQKQLLLDVPLSEAMLRSGYFPEYACQMLEAGEKAGRTEGVMQSLAAYYLSRHKLEGKLKSAVVYPTVLLLMMTGILVFLQIGVMPVFSNVYQSLSGNLITSSFVYIYAGRIIGAAALALTLALTLILLTGAIMARFEKGRVLVASALEKLPFTKKASTGLALARFTGILSIFTASGVDSDTAMGAAQGLVTHKELGNKIKLCRADMAQGKGLATAIFERRMFEPLYGRMLLSGARSGMVDSVLARLTVVFSEDADTQIDSIIDTIEPALSAFLTVVVGISLLTVMLPLIGILGSII